MTAATRLVEPNADASRASASSDWPRRSILFVGLVWLTAAIGKLVDLDSFRAAIATHALLPFPAALAWIVPVVELLLGAFLVLTSQSRGGRRNGALLFAPSLVLLAAFGVYITVLPAAKLEAAGCGCIFKYHESVAGWSASSLRMTHAALSAGFAICHVPFARWLWQHRRSTRLTAARPQRTQNQCSGG